jgi:hypothetical protein
LTRSSIFNPGIRRHDGTTERPKVYLTRACGSGEDKEYALDNGVAIIGFIEFSSLEKLSDYNSVVAFVKEAKPEFKPPRSFSKRCAYWRGLRRKPTEWLFPGNRW